MEEREGRVPRAAGLARPHEMEELEAGLPHAAGLTRAPEAAVRFQRPPLPALHSSQPSVHVQRRRRPQLKLPFDTTGLFFPRPRAP